MGVKKIDTHKGVSVKALLDSGTTGLFADKKFMEKWGFKKEKLARSIQIRNVDGTNNSRGMVMHKIECNLYYKRHVEQVKMDVCDLERIEVILGIPWLAVHNPEIDWKKREVKMTRCLPLYGRNQEIGKSKVKKQVKREEKPDEEIVRELVLKRF